MRWAICFIALLSAGCGHSPTSPDPVPPPTPAPSGIALNLTITETLSGGTLGAMQATVDRLPALVTVSFADHLTRQALVRSATASVDLIPMAGGFDLGFYRQLARNGYEASGSLEPLRLLTTSPSIYLQTTGLSAANITALEQAARIAVPAFSGNRLQVAAWQTGEELPADRAGWITVQIVNSADPCGRAALGEVVGHAWMNLAPRCTFGGYPVYPPSFAHEIGHALGFWHVGANGSLMRSDGPYSVSEPSAAEQYHAAIAYARPSGNRDLDQDALTSSFNAERVVVD